MHRFLKRSVNLILTPGKSPNLFIMKRIMSPYKRGKTNIAGATTRLPKKPRQTNLTSSCDKLQTHHPGECQRSETLGVSPLMQADNTEQNLLHISYVDWQQPNGPERLLTILSLTAGPALPHALDFHAHPDSLTQDISSHILTRTFKTQEATPLKVLADVHNTHILYEDSKPKY